MKDVSLPQSSAMTGITIREAKQEDFEGIADFCNRIFNEVEAAYITEKPETAKTVAQGGPFYIAIDSQGLLVGCVKFRPNPGGPFSLAVEPSFRNQGIGRELMMKVEEHAIRCGYSTLKTGIANFREGELFPYYQRLGYTKTGEKRYVFAPESTHYLVEIKKELQ